MPRKSAIKKAASKKDAVELTMKFRNYQDPLYYDAKVNDKIFVPSMPESEMNEAQKALLSSFPAADRGLFGDDDDEDDQTAPELVGAQEDFVEAAKLKAKLKQKAMREKKLAREEDDEDATQKRVRFVDDVEVGSEEDEDFDAMDSEEMVYDSEEEDHAEREYQKKKLKEEMAKKGINTEELKTADDFYDVAKEVKKVQKFKPADGVKFTQYDELGLPKGDGFDYHSYITTDTKPLDQVIEASPELMEMAYRPKGLRFDIDKPKDEMNAEEKAAYAALEACDGEYEELEDDFIFLANEGKPAIEVVEEDEDVAKKNGKDVNGKPFNLAEADFRSRDIQILTAEGYEDDMPDEDVALKEYRLKMAALLPDAGVNFAQKFGGQDELDAGFDAFMDEEYDEDKIGELMEEEVEAHDQIDKKVLDDACDEFIEDTKARFYGLAKEFGNENATMLIPNTKASDLIHEEDLKNCEDAEEFKAKLREKKVQNAGEFEEEAEKHLHEDVYRDKDEEDDEWDAETILSTYTNTDNHPGVIKTTRRVRPSQRMKIELHKQFKVPIDGLIPLAEEITLIKEKKAVPAQPFSRVIMDDKPPGSPRESNTAAGAAVSGEEEDEDAPVDKKAHKKMVKAQQKEKRQLKKQLKQAFSSQMQSQAARDVVDAGAIRQGVSVKKIY